MADYSSKYKGKEIDDAIDDMKKVQETTINGTHITLGGNISIPKGDTGPAGPQGPAGQNGADGKDGASDADEVSYNPTKSDYKNNTAGKAIYDLSQKIGKVYVNGHTSPFITTVDGVYTLDLSVAALKNSRVYVYWGEETSALNVLGCNDDGEWVFDGECLVNFDGGNNLDDSTAIVFDAASVYGSMPTWTSGVNVIAIMSDDNVVYAPEFQQS